MKTKLTLKKPTKKQIENRNDKYKNLEQALKKHFGPVLFKKLNESMSGYDLGDLKYVNPKPTMKEYRLSRKVLEVNIRVVMKLSAIRMLHDHIEDFPFTPVEKKRVLHTIRPVIQQMKDNPAYFFIFEAYLGNELPIDPTKLLLQLEEIIKKEDEEKELKLEEAKENESPVS